MHDGIGVITQKHRFVGVGAVQTIFFLDQMAQGQHAKARAHSIVAVHARQMHDHALPFDVMDEIADPRFQSRNSLIHSPLLCTRALETSDTGRAGTTRPTSFIK